MDELYVLIGALKFVGDNELYRAMRARPEALRQE